MNGVSHTPVKAKKAHEETPADGADDFEAIEQAVMATPRGRWFLAEYLRRRQSAELKRLLDAMRKLQDVAASRSVPSAAHGETLEGLRLLLAQTADELARGLGEVAEPTLPEAAAGRLGRLLEAARAQAGQDAGQAQQSLMLLTDVLHGMLARLAGMLGEPVPREGKLPDSPSASPERQTAARQNAQEDKSPADAPRGQPPATTVRPEKPQPDPQLQPQSPSSRGKSKGLRRIVILRHGHSGEIDIPLPEHDGESSERKPPDSGGETKPRPKVRIR